MVQAGRWSLWTLLTIILAAGGLAVGCDGGSSPMPPVITAIQPTGAIGVPGQFVQFSAQVTGTGPFTYAWDFDGGTDPATATDPTPTVELGAVGTYHGTLTVTDASSEWTAEPFEFAVQPLPEIQNISPSGTIGRPLRQVTFAADVTGFVESYAWDFGGGAEPNTSTDATPAVAIQAPGDYTGSLTVFANGAAVEARPFSYRVEAATAPAFSITRVGPQATGSPQPSTNVCLVNHLGRLALVYNHPTEGVMLARAKTEVPSGCCDWEQHVIDPEGTVVFPRSIATIGGRLALVYEGPSGGLLRTLWVAVAATEEPGSIEQWMRYQLATDEPTASEFVSWPWSIIEAGGILRILATTYVDGVQELVYWTASREHPASAEDWSASRATEGYTGGYKEFMLAEIAGTIQAAVLKFTESGGGGTVGLLQADSLTPSGPENWRFASVSIDGAQVTRGFDLIEDASRPFLAFPESNVLPFPRPIWLFRATVPEPGNRVTNEADWETLQLTALTDDNIGSAVLVRSQERLAVAFQDRNSKSTMLGRQIGPDSMAVGDWEVITIESGLFDVFSGFCAIADLNGRLAVAYAVPLEGQVGVAVASDEY